MAAGPVLELEAGNTLELALIVGDENEPRVNCVCPDPQIVRSDQSALPGERRAKRAVRYMTVQGALSIGREPMRLANRIS